MIVDAQVHLWAQETTERPWIKGGSGAPHLPDPLTYQRMLGLMDDAGVDRVIIVPPSWAGDDNAHALEAAQRHPDRFAVMGLIALDRPESKNLIPSWKSKFGMLGIRLPFNYDRASWMADGTADWLWPAAEDADIPVMIFAPDTPEMIGQVARQHPRLRIIVDHMGLATRGPEFRRIRERLDLIVSFACLPNVAIKLSALPDFSGEPYPFRDMNEHVQRVVSAFGPRRCFWGTDVSHSRGRYAYRQYVRHFMEELDFLSGEDRRWIMGEAILQFLGWPDHPK
jgi:predicted TIM-barrel fold metal-dependent hydrolase